MSARAAHVRDDRRRIARIVRRVSGRTEVGVRVLFERQAAPPSAPAATTSRRTRASAGAEYLRLKKRQRDRSAELVKRGAAVVSALYDRLERRAALARRRPASNLVQGSGSLLLDAAFLVPREDVMAFRSAVAREAKALAGDGYRVTTNGPWPPYSFIEE